MKKMSKCPENVNKNQKNQNPKWKNKCEKNPERKLKKGDKIENHQKLIEMLKKSPKINRNA